MSKSRPDLYNRKQGTRPDGLAFWLGDDTDGIMTDDDLVAARARIAAAKAAREQAAIQPS
jgi:hypothetical protein